MTQDTISFNEPNTRETLLTVAEKLFAQHGYEATTVRLLGDASHINAASINYHFGSKENLLKAIFERRLNALNTKFQCIKNLRFDTEQEVIEIIMDILIHFSNEHAHFFDLLFRELSAFKVSKCRRLLFVFFKETMQILDALWEHLRENSNRTDRFLLLFQLFSLSHPILNISSKFEGTFSRAGGDKQFHYHPIRLKHYLAKF